MTVIGPDGPIVNAASQPKRLALLALLARAGERGITRDKALGYFWPDAEEDRARRSLANAVWALRRELESEDVFLPGNDLRLNPDVIDADVREFEDAVAAGDLARAATLYEGPFLDGFRLAGAPEFDRWVEAERAALANRYLGAVERLARSAEAKGATEEAIGWWRKITAQDPLNAKFALGLMRALAASGDRIGAVRHAQIYEALIDQELDLPPDRHVVDYARELREALAATQPSTTERQTADRDAPAGVTAGGLDREAGEAPEEAERAVAVWSEPAADRDATVGFQDAAVAAAVTPAPTPTRRRLTIGRFIAGAAVVTLAAAAVFAIRSRMQGTAVGGPVIALGQITDYRVDRSTEIVKPLADMLATALARSPAIQVVSNARMYELANANGSSGGTLSPEAYVSAARSAGATELLAGALYAVNDSILRLDLQRIDLSTGKVRAAQSVVAHDAFGLADSGTVRLLSALGVDAPAGSVADVTTRSLTAYRFYEEGLRAFYQDDVAAAERLFTAALAEDTAFASAAYYLSLTIRQDDGRTAMPILERAVRLSARAGDRERLNIRARWELATSSANLRATAESLLMRFPQEVEGYLFTGIVRVADGRFLEGVPYLERAITMDSLSLRGERAECNACEAYRWVITAYEQADSLALAEREVRRWLKYQPGSGLAYLAAIDVLMCANRVDEAIAAWRERSKLAPGRETDATVGARLRLKAGLFDEADATLKSAAELTSSIRRADALGYIAMSERYQGRLAEALKHADEEYRLIRDAYPGTAPAPGGATRGQVLFELGRYRESAAEFDRIAFWTPPVVPSSGTSSPGALGRHRAWYMTHAADALAAMGDTAGLAARADSIERYGSRSLYRLHRELHHHVRGLLLAARHRDDEAIAEFRMAMTSPNVGFTRTNIEMARALLRRGRPAEAIATLQPAIRGNVEAANFYVTITEVHELLGQAWDSLGVAAARGESLPPRIPAAVAGDSAAAHYEWAARAWKEGDRPYAERAERARVRAAILRR